MKLIKHLTDLNKAINKERNLGFVPTMGSLHRGHESLIKISKEKCKKTLVTIFVNPTQFNNKKDYKTYPRNLNNDLKILKKLKVDFVYLPTVNQIFNDKKMSRVTLNKSQKILCAKFRKGHFEGVLNVLNRFVKIISPRLIFMGKKDFQQFFLVKKLIEKNYKTKVYVCKTIRDKNMIALSSRNNLLNKNNLIKLKLITKKLLNLKKTIYNNRQKSKQLILQIRKKLVKEFKIKIEYAECRNTLNLKTDIQNKSFKLFVAFYLDKVRLIDNF
tara:strand:- start:314 stop:1129 length:816 start_codon:yes stop_codon:yes gene_type:complete